MNLLRTPKKGSGFQTSHSAFSARIAILGVFHMKNGFRA